MKPTTIKLINWIGCSVVVIVLGGALWQMWAEADNPIRYWQRILRQGDTDRRRQAADILMRQGNRAVAPDLMRALDDPDAEVRSLAIQGLGQVLALGRDGVAEVDPSVIEQLKGFARQDPLPRIRASAIGVVAALAPDDAEARALALAKLENLQEDDEVRAAALAALGRDWQLSEEGLRYCSDPSPRVRLVAMQRLSSFQRRSRPFHGFGHGFGRGHDSDLAREHRRPPWDLPVQPYLGIALRGLDDPDPAVRAAAIWLLPRSPRELAGPWRDAFPKLLVALNDEENAEIRKGACYPLWALSVGTELAPRAIEALKSRLDDPDIGSVAADVLTRFGADAVSALPALARVDADGVSHEADAPAPFSYARHIALILGAWLAYHPPGC